MIRASGRTNDAGVSFVETVVVMLLAAVIGLVTTTVIVTTFRRTSEMDGRTTALIQTRQALQRTLRDLRSANPLEGLTANRLEERIVTAAGVKRDLTYTVTTTIASIAMTMLPSSLLASRRITTRSGCRRSR